MQAMFGTAAAGGVLRYGNEDWIMGYNRFLGECSVFDADLWVILDGLEVVKAIQDFSLADSNSTLIRRIHQLLANVGHWVMQHIPRELNEIANCMAKLAFDTGQNLMMFEKILKEALAISPI
ncbi:hypothetical protein Gogos_019446, partial [Gossypium gossypioides]|nr:hypothetical protein [Gossypium gossypioides]